MLDMNFSNVTGNVSALKHVGADAVKYAGSCVSPDHGTGMGLMGVASAHEFYIHRGRVDESTSTS
jgi:hypothetical protein